jgi:aspartyl-tRNA(Asn)/glutamyl-tRNA(Gln) amidotransferase subunit A
MELFDLSAQHIATLVKSREISATEIIESVIARIETVDGVCGTIDTTDASTDDNKIHAFITRTFDSARKQAEEVDKAVANGDDPGLLAGVPFTVKDIFCVQGTPSTAGSRILANFIAPYSATPVERMFAAGGILLGKVNLDEFTYGSSNESSAYKPTPRNPWDSRRVPGGSSGGSAAAVASGQGALSLGTDTAGSIRQPAAFCGVVGIKPTYGRVSRYGLIAFGSSLDCPGPLARDVSDAALMLQVIAGADPCDSTAAYTPVPDYLKELNKDICGMRIGLSPDYFRITYTDLTTGELHQEAITPTIQTAIYRVAGRLAELGADIVEDVPMPHTHYGIPAYFVISRVEAASNLHRYDGVKYGYRTPEYVDNLHEMYRKSRAQGFGLQPKLRILMGMYVSAAQYSEQYYNKALRVRSLIRQDFEQTFDQMGKYRIDALLAPTTPSSAFPIAEVYGDSVLMQYADQLTVPANHAGNPAMSFPVGFDQVGLPIGAQLLGPDFSESRLLRIARSYEKVTMDEAWRSRTPPLE